MSQKILKGEKDLMKFTVFKQDLLASRQKFWENFKKWAGSNKSVQAGKLGKNIGTSMLI